MNCRQPSGDGQAIDHSRLKAELIEAAAMLHGLGLSVIPIRPGKQGHHKSPALKAWRPYQAVRMPPDSLLPKIERSRDCVGIAVILGAVSGGLMVRDFDTAEGYHAWAAREPHLASILPTVRTAKGFHVYARSASTVPSRRFNRPGEAEPGELRAEGNYVVTAPSLHASGIRYAWAIPPGDAIPVVEPSAFIPEGYAAREGSDKRRNGVVLHKTSGSCVTRGGVPHPEPTELAPVEADIRRSLPSRAGERNSRLFEFLRRLKAREPGASFDEIEDKVGRWHEVAYPVIGTKDLATTLAEAKSAWARIREPKGEKLRLAVAEARARSIPEGLPPREGLLLNLCGELAGMQGRGGRFYLAASTASQALGADNRMAGSRALKALVGLGLIRSVRSGSLKGMRAQEFALTPKGREVLGLEPDCTPEDEDVPDPF